LNAARTTTPALWRASSEAPGRNRQPADDHSGPSRYETGNTLGTIVHVPFLAHTELGAENRRRAWIPRPTAWKVLREKPTAAYYHAMPERSRGPRSAPRPLTPLMYRRLLRKLGSSRSRFPNGRCSPGPVGQSQTTTHYTLPRRPGPKRHRSEREARSLHTSIFSPGRRVSLPGTWPFGSPTFFYIGHRPAFLEDVQPFPLGGEPFFSDIPGPGPNRRTTLFDEKSTNRASPGARRSRCQLSRRPGARLQRCLRAHESIKRLNNNGRSTDRNRLVAPEWAHVKQNERSVSRRHNVPIRSRDHFGSTTFPQIESQLTPRSRGAAILDFKAIFPIPGRTGNGPVAASLTVPIRSKIYGSYLLDVFQQPACPCRAVSNIQLGPQAAHRPRGQSSVPTAAEIPTLEPRSRRRAMQNDRRLFRPRPSRSNDDGRPRTSAYSLSSARARPLALIA